MGIRGIYGQIGPGRRIALSKLAIEHYEKHNRPIRIAIDISIWNFQIQSGKGGSNPALRTLYYRLVRLLALAIQPIFIFDGPNKPPFKRNSKTVPNGVSLPNYLTKQLLKLFGFPFHTAPGEAEAECALLQKEGVVDAVFSEDVDTLMFGCSLTLRNWSSEGTRGSKSPTHVSVYTSQATKQACGLDSDGMILVALMSGGDYIPAGLPRCGIKIACEVAKASFGHDLCRIPKTDLVGFQQWRQRLNHELKTNSSGYFRAKHKTLNIPNDFPNMTVLGYYTDPVISSREQVLRLSSTIQWGSKIDISGLRKFVAEAFEWNNMAGAKKFLRGFAPALLVHQLCERAQIGKGTAVDLERQEVEEKKIINEICGRRNHFSTDATPELRISYVANDIVGLDLTNEEGDTLGREDCSDLESGRDDFAELREVHNGSPTTKATRSIYDPGKPEKTWILESFAKLGVPLLVENWEDRMRNPIKTTSKRGTAQKERNQKTINSYLKVSKAAVKRNAQPKNSMHSNSSPKKPLEPSENISTSANSIIRESQIGSSESTHNAPDKDSHKRDRVERNNSSQVTAKPQSPLDSNLFPLNVEAESLIPPKRPSDTFNIDRSSISRYSALGIYEGSSLNVDDSSSNTPRPNSLTSMIISPDCKLATSPSPSDDCVIISPVQYRGLDDEQLRPSTPCFGSESTQAELDSSNGHPKVVLPESLPGSSPESLPSPSALLSPPETEKSLKKPISKSMINVPSSPTEALKRRRQVKLRESVAGAWRAIDANEASGAGLAATYRNVEVVDLT